MKFTVYTKNGCPQCDQSKALLNALKKDYQEVYVAAGLVRGLNGMLASDFTSKYPDVRMMPYIEATDASGNVEVVGTLQNLRKYLED